MKQALIAIALGALAASYMGCGDKLLPVYDAPVTSDEQPRFEPGDETTMTLLPTISWDDSPESKAMLEAARSEEAEDDVDKTTFITGFGVEDNPEATRCSLPYSNNHCKMPSSKTRSIFNQVASTCGAAGVVNWPNVVQLGITAAAAQWSGTGFAVTDGTASSFNIKVRCTSSGFSGGQMARGDALKFNCDSNGNCHISQTDLLIRGSYIEGVLNNQNPALTQNQKDRFVKNILIHEMNHIAGLGHFPLGTSEGVLMAQGVAPTSFAAINTLMAPTNEEQNWLSHFIP
jgi:hypothetical protein